MWLEAEVGDAVTGLELREKPGTVVRNSEAVAVSSCSGQHTQMCTHTHIGLGKSIITNLKKNDCNITLTTNIIQIGRSHIRILVCKMSYHPTFNSDIKQNKCFHSGHASQVCWT